MGQLLVRNIDEELVRSLKIRAARHGRSMEAEHREILRVSLEPERRRASLKSLLASMPDVGSDEDFVVRRDMPRDLD